MPDSTPLTNDRTIVVHRSGALTYVSLALNALILLLILGAILHHHRMRDEGPGDGRMGPPGWASREGDRPGDDHDEFRHGGGFDPRHHGWCHEGGFSQRDGGACPMGGPGGDHRGFGMDEHQGWGGPGEDHRGFGMDEHQGWGGENHAPDFGGPSMGFGPRGDHPTTPPSSEEMTDRLMLMLAPKLSLTDAESAQIRPIIASDIQQFQKDMETQKQEHRKMIDDAKAKVCAILTPDQQKQFDTMTAGMGGPATPSSPPAK